MKPPYICYDNYRLLDPALVKGDATFASEEERRFYDIVSRVNRDLKTYGNALLGKDLVQVLALKPEQAAPEIAGVAREEQTL